MKLLACHIENFGKLSDYSFTFSDGLNVLNRPNGWGKSTFAVFLKAMFYGLDERTLPGDSETERHRYLPWQGGIFGGTLDFEAGGRRYRLRRTFGRTSHADEFALWDLLTMRESKDYTDHLGEELFDLDATSFCRSIFIGQDDCPCTATSGISAKLGHLAEGTNDINNYETAMERIRDASNRLSPSRVTGSIKRRRLLMEQLGVGIQSLNAAEEEYDQIRQTEQDAAAEKERLSRRRQQAVEDLSDAGSEQLLQEKRLQYQSLCEREQQQKEKYQEYKAGFPAGVPSEEELRAMTGIVRQMADVSSQIRNAEAEEEEAGEEENSEEEWFPYGAPTKEMVEEQIKKQEECVAKKTAIAEEQKKEISLREELKEETEEITVETKVRPSVGSVVGAVLIAFSVAGIVAGILLPFLLPDLANVKYAPVIGLIGAGVLCIAASVFFQIGKRQAEDLQDQLEDEQMRVEEEKKRLMEPLVQLQAHIAKMEEENAESEDDILAFLARYYGQVMPEQMVSSLYDLSKRLDAYEKKNRALGGIEEAEQKLADLTEEVNAFAEHYQLYFGDDLAAELEHVQKEAADCRTAQEAYEDAAEKRELFAAQNEEVLLSAKEGVKPGIEQMNQVILETDERMRQVDEELLSCKSRMNELQQQIKNRKELEEQLKDAMAEQEEEMQQFEILQTAQQYLTKAKESFTSRYMGPMEQSFRRYFTALRQEGDDDWQIGSDIRFQLQQGGQMRDVKELSVGYQDLIGLCMRLSLADVMYEKEKPFLILDDPLVDLDNEKVETGKELLSDVAQQYQLIYFTCHDSRVPET